MIKVIAKETGGGMRDIEFRYWYKGKLYPALTLVEMVHDGEFEGTDIADCIVMQYTGLTDRNGKKIFEGDICDYGFLAYDIGIVKGEVIFDEGQFILYSEDRKNYFPVSEGTEIEVIGDIYQNPELLKGLGA